MRVRWRPVYDALRITLGLCGLLLTTFAAPCRAEEVAVAFPLGDYYRPGRYVPVRVSVVSGADLEGRVVRLQADGAVPTEWTLGPGARGPGVVVPWLTLDVPAPLTD